MAQIYLDAWGMHGGPSGLNRYCRSLIPELVGRSPQHQFTILRPPGESGHRQPLVPSASAREIILAHRSSDIALVLSRPLLGRLFRRYGPPDLLHSLFHLLPLGIRRGALAPKRVVVTLHDTIWIDHADLVEHNWAAAAIRRQFARAAIPYALRTADHVICNSSTTAARAAEWVDSHRTTAVHLGVGPDFYQTTEPPVSVVPALVRSGVPYIAALGVRKAYKNIDCLLQAFVIARASLAHLHLVLIGGDGGTRRLMRRLETEDAVTVTRPLADAELRSVIAHARLFVVPSLAEGFGLPVIEAMALGTPVAIAAIAALREVGGDAAAGFDPHNPASLAEAIERVVCNQAAYDSLAARGRIRASTFSWSTAAALTLAIYDRLLAS